MESLQDWGFMGDIHIGYGFIRRKIAGNISLFWGWFVVAFGVAEPFTKAKSVRLPGGGLLFYEEK